MRIIKTSKQSHRYAKVLSTELTGMIGRLYLEVQERKAFEKTAKEELHRQGSTVHSLDREVESISVQNRKISNILDQIFPDGEAWAVIDRPLMVEGKVKAEGIQVTSKEMVKNLNAEMLAGETLASLNKTTDGKVADLEKKVTETFVSGEIENLKKFAPITHVNEGGPGVHPYATEALAGFMSPLDKKHHDAIKTKTDQIELPGGIVVSETPPANPRFMQLWVDISGWTPPPVEPEEEV